MELKNKKIAFLGDSITEGHGATNNYGYVDYIHEYTGAICDNLGIGGTRIAKQKGITFDNPAYDNDFCKRAKDIKGGYDVIVVFGGTNDYGHGDADFGAFDDRTSDTFYGGLHELFSTLIANNPDTPIVVITPLHRLEEDTVKNSVTGLYLKSYVKAIREVAEYYSLPIIDLFKNCGIQPSITVIKDMYMQDGLHPTDLGHQKIAKIISRNIEMIF